MSTNTKDNEGASTETSVEEKQEQEEDLGKKEEEQVECSTCGKPFGNENSAKMHALRAHGSKRAWNKDMSEAKKSASTPNSRSNNGNAEENEGLFADYPTVVDILEETLEEDPKIKDKHKEYIIGSARDKFAFSPNDLEKEINYLAFDGYKKAKSRLTDKYQNKLEREMRDDEQILLDDEWATLAARNSQYTPDQIQKDIEQRYGFDRDRRNMNPYGVTDGSQSNNGGGINVPINSNQTAQSRANNQQPSNGGMSVSNMLGRGRSGSKSSNGGNDFDQMLEEHLDRITKVQLINLMSQGDLAGAQQLLNGEAPTDSRQNNVEEEEGSDINDEALQKFGEALEGINERINVLEERIQQDGTASEEKRKGLVEEIRELNEAKQEMESLVASQTDDGSDEMNQALMQALQQMNEKIDTALTKDQNPDELTPAKAELEKKKLDNKLTEKEIEGKKEIAKEISDSIKEGLNLAGSQIGKNVSNSILEEDNNAQAMNGGSNNRGGTPPQNNRKSTITPEPIMSNGEPTGKWKFTCEECNSDVIYEEGADKVQCDCGMTYDLKNPKG